MESCDRLHPGEPGATRTKPPWNEGGPSLRVGYDPGRAEYIIRAPGGHIIGATTSLEEVGRLIRYESDYGFGSVELALTGRHPDDTYTWHGLKRSTRVSPGVSNRRGRAAPGRLQLSLADLDLT